VLEVAAFRVDACLHSLREVVDDLLAQLQRDLLPGLLECALQLILASVDPAAGLLLQDAPDRVIQRVEVRAIGGPGVLPPELSEVVVQEGQRWAFVTTLDCATNDQNAFEKSL
jgi:hypothetical protein